MRSDLNTLEGMVIENVLKIHDYVQILFEKDIVLSIYNEYKLSYNDNIGFLKGTKLARVEESPNRIILYFSNGISLDINLHDEAYNGPEALELYIPGRPAVVWN
jgi:hypothetical protein